MGPNKRDRGWEFPLWTWSRCGGEAAAWHSSRWGNTWCLVEWWPLALMQLAAGNLQHTWCSSSGSSSMPHASNHRRWSKALLLLMCG